MPLGTFFNSLEVLRTVLLFEILTRKCPEVLDLLLMRTLILCKKFSNRDHTIWRVKQWIVKGPCLGNSILQVVILKPQDFLWEVSKALTLNQLNFKNTLNLDILENLVRLKKLTFSKIKRVALIRGLDLSIPQTQILQIVLPFLRTLSI